MSQVTSSVVATQVGSFAPIQSSEPRPVEHIYSQPPLHWVGDGFRVAGYFSAIPDAMRRLDPFLLMDYHPAYAYEPSSKARGVGVHPHRGFETVTLAYQGSVAHHDSTGGGGVIGPGDVQWMTAGAGILHKEYHEQAYAKRGGPFQMVQLWVNLPRAQKMTAPRYQPLEAQNMGRVSLPDGSGQLRVIAGQYAGVRGPAKTFSPINVYDAELEPGAKLQFAFPARQTALLLVMAGELSINDSERARANDLVVFANRGERVELTAVSASKVLVLNGEPLGEPIVQYGPFVMNTPAEIRQAMIDYAQGKFGTLED
jgi:hypothetical protein